MTFYVEVKVEYFRCNFFFCSISVKHLRILKNLTSCLRRQLLTTIVNTCYFIHLVLFLKSEEIS